MKNIWILGLASLVSLNILAQVDDTNKPRPRNSLNNLKLTYQKSSQLGLTNKALTNIKAKISEDSLVASYYEHLRKNADLILDEPFLEEKKKGVKFLPTARTALQRLGTLSIVYKISEDEKYLERLNKEILSVCQFPTWNPSHFLDVSELSLGVSLGIDWCAQELPDSTLKIARNKLRQQLIFSFDKNMDQNWWIQSKNNWNVVCHTGMTAAALVLKDHYPELSSQVIDRAIKFIPNGLGSYSPNGAYKEGPTYWAYCSYYSAILFTILESANIPNSDLVHTPGFLESATYRLMINSPDNQVFNYADSDDETMNLYTQGILVYFALKAKNNLFFDKEAFKKNLNRDSESYNTINSRFAPFTLIWLAQIGHNPTKSLPQYWMADGKNPIAVIRDSIGSKSGFFLAIKGGKANISHGHMDAGSFVFDLNGVRWSLDIGRDDYSKARKIIGWRLFDNSQKSPRWSLLDKNNFGHSTITVNNQTHNVKGFAELYKADTMNNGNAVSVDLTEVFQPYIRSANRTFVRKADKILQIRDVLRLTDSCQSITWSMLTTADVEVKKEGVLLNSNGKSLMLTILSPKGLEPTVVSLDPPPLKYDKQIQGLKRIEIRIENSMLDTSELELLVELQGLD